MSADLGLDTSVVLRLLTGQPKAQVRAAQARIETAINARHRVIVTDLVLSEAYFALVYHYEVPKKEAESMLRTMLRSGVVDLEPSSCMAAFALKGPGLVDRMIHARYASENATTLTFDKRMAKLTGAEPPT